MTMRRRRTRESLMTMMLKRNRATPLMRKALMVSLCCMLLVTLAPALFVGADLGSRGDGNDSFETAQPASNDKQVLGTLNATSDPEDYFWINAKVGQVVDTHNIALDYNFSDPEEIDFDLEIYGPADHDEPLATSSTKDQFEINNVLVTVEGKYYMKLIAVNGSGQYAFTVKVYEPEVMTDGGVYKGYLKRNSHNDTWWYKIYLEGGNPADAVKVTMTHDGTGNLDLILVDLWSSERAYYINLSWWMGPPNEEVYGVASYTGYYYLKVQAWEGWGNYNLKVETSEAPTDGDNDKTMARLLEYNTTWIDRVDMGVDKYDVFEVRLMPQETISIDLKLMDTWDDIYSVMLVDVDLELVIERTNYIFEPAHDTGDTIKFSKEVEGGVYYVMVMAKVALTEDPDDLSDETAAADYTIVINMSAHDERPVNRAPTVKSGMEDLSIVTDEDTTHYLNLNDVFLDPDGDKLVFTAVPSGTNITVSVDLSGTVTIIPKRDWYGETVINFTAKDPGGLEDWLIVNVTVRSRTEPPIITDYGPSRTWSLAEGETVRFFVNVSDQDSPVVWFNWSVDGTDMHRHVSEFDYTTGYDDAGPHVIEVTVTDGENVNDLDWEVSVNNTNRLPIISSVSPKNGTKFKKDEDVNLAALVEDPDGDGFGFEWRKGLEVIAQGEDVQPNINHTFPPGKHTIKLTVVDSEGGMSSAEVRFEVEAGRAGVDWWWWATGAMVALIVAFIIFAFASPSKKLDEDEIDDLVEEEIRKKESAREDEEDEEEGVKRRKRGGRKGRRRGRKGKRAKDKKKRKKKRKKPEAGDEALEEDVDKEIEMELKRMGKKEKKKEKGKKKTKSKKRK
jgi:hypothetical protein